MPALVFDIGGTRIKAGLAIAGALTATATAATDDSGSATAVVAQLVELGRGLTSGERPSSLGVSVRGIVDARAGTVTDVNPPLRCLIGQPLAELLGSEFGAPAHVENDARLHLLGELRHGRGRGTANVVCVTLGTGVGTAVALSGRILSGPHGAWGILGGHLTVSVDGPLCTCGNVGCLEMLIGTDAIVRDARDRLSDGTPSELTGRQLDPATIFAAATAGDAVADAVVTGFARALSAGVVNLVHAYDPDLVIFGGGLSRSAAQFLPLVSAYVNEHAWTQPKGRTRLETAELGESAALIGAAELAGGDDWAWK